MKIYDYHGRKNMCGDRIKIARAARKVSQSDLAARLHVAGVIVERDSISRIEIGTRFVPDYEVVESARALEVSIEWLLGQTKDDLNP